MPHNQKKYSILVILLILIGLGYSCSKEEPVIHVQSVSLSETSVELTEGDSRKLVVTVSPSNATDKTISWTSSNASVVSVQNGEIKALSTGKAIIEAKAENKLASCSVTVKAKTVPVVSIDFGCLSMTMYKGESTTLIAKVSPDNATNQILVWHTSDASVATVNNGVVKAIAVGSACITAVADDIGASCTITVKEPVNGSHEGLSEEDVAL